jgi:hypothetical protein
MLFPTPEFAIFFFLIFVAAWALRAQDEPRKFLLLAGSYYFYGSWDWRFMGLLAGSSTFNYAAGLLIARSKDEVTRKRIVGVAVAANLSLLGVFKYYNFFMDNIKREHARVYWVGLPPVRSDSLTHAYRIMNGIYRREAARHRFEYVDIWDELTTSSGAYSSFGKSLKGVKRRIRMEDGQHFTEVGRLVFAADVARAAGLRR